MTAAVGAQLAQPDPRGWLAFDHLPDDLQRTEDSTLAADRERRDCATFDTPAVWDTTDPSERDQRVADALQAIAGCPGVTVAGRRGAVLVDILGPAGGTYRASGFVRPATTTERQLLSHLGYELTGPLYTACAWPTDAIRNRRWPQLESQETEN